MNEGEGVENEGEGVENEGENSDNERNLKMRERILKMRLRGLSGESDSEKKSEEKVMKLGMIHFKEKERPREVHPNLFAPTRANKKTKAKFFIPTGTQATNFFISTIAQHRTWPFNACCRIIITTTIKPWRIISTTKLLERARVSPQMEIRSKKKQDAKAVNPDETCKQQ
ncbi:hypothetical protein Salat_1148300 [Sesamum alatum]|uniref:Uncharacterized protein n=1 Tax=Sesamum alatum TaxID=300844 RepID=A0AAE1YED8_9LAMI|nr:hypothetical protein Salat_1148300 [Sesamum alatum]